MTSAAIQVLLAIVAPILSGPDSGAEAPLSAADACTMLQTLENEELTELLWSLERRVETAGWNAEDIAAILTVLEPIEAADPFQKLVVPKSKSPDKAPRLVFVNRRAAADLRKRLEVEQLLVPIRALPTRERIIRLMDEHESAELSAPGTRIPLVLEFVRAGQGAVPTLVDQGHRVRSRTAVIKALGRLKDSRAIDFLVRVLGDREHEHMLLRAEAAEALANFGSDDVLQALIDGLDDPDVEKLDACMPQQLRPGHVPCNARLHRVRYFTAVSLRQITGKHWGWLFQEDRHTWQAWRDQGMPDGFVPTRVARTRSERCELGRNAIHLYMSGRPNAWQPSNELESGKGFDELASDIATLGDESVDCLVEECQQQLREQPIWEPKLRPWAVKLLSSVGTPAASAAADKLR